MTLTGAGGSGKTRLAQEVVRTLATELAGAQRESDQQIRELEAAVPIQDAMAYIEPPGWYFPARHLLGAALLAADRAAEAEAVYRADLQQHPKAVSVVSAHRTRAPASVNPLIHSLTNSGFFLPKSGMSCNVERRLRALLHQAGFTQVCGSASFLAFGTPESLQWLAEIFSRFTLDSPYAVEWLVRGSDLL